MVSNGFEPGAVLDKGLKAWMNRLSYGGPSGDL